MNALAPIGGNAALVPHNMHEAMQLADMMAKTGFLARELQTPGGALFVIEQAMRWNMSPFAVAMETSFIQGKPMFSGKIVSAAVVSMGAIIGRLSYDYSGAGDGRTVIVRGTVRGESEPREVSVRVGDAKTANKVWTTQPDQQLAYHGARVWARRHTPEVMLGVYSPDEMEEAPAMPAARGATIASTAERVRDMPAEVPLVMMAPDGTEKNAPSIQHWGAWCGKAIAVLEDAPALVAWRAAMEPHFDAIRLAEPAAVDHVAGLAQDRLDALADAGGWE